MNNGSTLCVAPGNNGALPIKHARIYVRFGRECLSDIEVEVEGLELIKTVLHGRFTRLICKYYQMRQEDLAAGLSDERAGWRLASKIAQDLSVEDTAVASYKSAVNGAIRKAAEAQTPSRIASMFETRRGGGSRISPRVEITFEG